MKSLLNRRDSAVIEGVHRSGHALASFPGTWSPPTAGSARGNISAWCLFLNAALHPWNEGFFLRDHKYWESGA
jgi:hypothetical protein